MPWRLLHPTLRFFSLIYGGIVRARNHLYDRSLFRARPAGARVVSVGNITVGGTGKTPLVHLLAEEALGRGFRPAVLARGYRGRSAGEVTRNDEGLMLARRLPDLILVQQPDRVDAARRAVCDLGADLLILDDGFQHRRLMRDLDIVVVDATRPFGCGRLLPAGLLREPLSGLARAHAFVISRTDLVEPNRLDGIEKILGTVAPKAPVFPTIHRPLRLRNMKGSYQDDPHILSGRKVFCFSGIAHPDAFQATLAGLGAAPVGRMDFPDHHWFGKEDLDAVLRRAGETRAEFVVTTEKDGARLEGLEGAGDLLVLEVGLLFQERGDAFLSLVFGVGTGPGRDQSSRGQV